MKQFTFFVIYHCVLLLTFSDLYCSGFSPHSISDVTSNVFPEFEETTQGYVAAFVDINSDKETDILMICGNRQSICVYLTSPQNSLPFHHQQTINVTNSSFVTALFPADFNADGEVDVLVTLQSGPTSVVSLLLVWGLSGGRLSTSNAVKVGMPFSCQPLLVDANFDTIPDLFVSHTNNTRYFLLGQHGPAGSDWNFQFVPFIVATNSTDGTSSTPVRVPHANALVDFRGDGVANFFVTTMTDDVPSFEKWQATEKGLQLLGAPMKFQRQVEVGQSVFLDVNGDLAQDHLIPTCLVQDSRCTNSKITWIDDGGNRDLFISTDGWNFVPRQASFEHHPITLSLGDFNQDNILDVLCIMQQFLPNSTLTPRTVVLLYGTECSSHNCPNTTYDIKRSVLFPESDDAFSAAFFDLESNGNLDILVSIWSGTTTSVKAYKNGMVEDTSFMVAKVFQDSLGSGASMAGVTVSYATANTVSTQQRAASVQLSQTAHLALQLPYIYFGLGRLPNFVDELTVSVPPCLLPAAMCGKALGGHQNCNHSKKSWTMIIPNSRLFITADPLCEPSEWSNRLLVTPGRNILDTFAVLLATIAVLSIAILTLHCFERRDDKQERIEGAHRFHFDAM